MASDLRFCSAPGRTRTCDPLLRRQPLYPLSYRGSRMCELRFKTILVGAPHFAGLRMLRTMVHRVDDIYGRCQATSWPRRCR